MSSTPKTQLNGDAILASFESILHGFIEDLCIRTETDRKGARFRLGQVRHFLIWTVLNGIALEEIDGSVIDRFAWHDCDCWSTVPMLSRGRWLRRWRARRKSAAVDRFVGYLERTGQIPTPGDLENNFGLIEDFIERLRNDGYTSWSSKKYRGACTGFIIWLHRSRIPLHELNAEVYGRYLDSEFSCSIPDKYYGRKAPSPGSARDMEIRRFLDHLVLIGQIQPLWPASQEEELPGILERFSGWLKRNRGIRPPAIRIHLKHIGDVLPDLGEDPAQYEAASIRRALLEKMEGRSQSQAGELITAMRMYLRFLASEGAVSGALVNAVPTMRRYRLSSLPRYIPDEDIERTIESCGDHHAGIRDRAILLLLARLALRAGDVAALRLGDIDWDRAEIRVSGKSGRETALPLPQDVGDALRTYITTARPRVANEEKVFLRVMAPHRACSHPAFVGRVVNRALNRTGVAVAPGHGGAYLFRHSRATSLLRSGAPLQGIQCLLRHQSMNTTMIYAKTNAVMLQEVAQPWIGGGAEE